MVDQNDIWKFIQQGEVPLALMTITIFLYSYAQNRHLVTIMYTPAIITYYTRKFLPYNERRTGKVQITDDVLDSMEVTTDTSYIVNAIMYVSLVAWALFGLIVVQSPMYLLVGVHGYVYIVSLRMLFMKVTPLSVHPRCKPLVDWLANTATSNQLKDELMFSGHTSLLTLIILMVSPYYYTLQGEPVPKESYVLSSICFVALLVLMYAMLLSKVHYVIDILVALCVAPLVFYCTICPPWDTFCRVTMFGFDAYLMYFSIEEMKTWNKPTKKVE